VSNLWRVEWICFRNLDVKYVGGALVRRVRRASDLTAQFRETLALQLQFYVTFGNLLNHHDSSPRLIITTHYHDSLSVITPTLFPQKYELMNSLNHNRPFNVPLSRMTRVSLHQNLETLTHSHPVFVAIDSIFSFLHFLQFIAHLSGLTISFMTLLLVFFDCLQLLHLPLQYPCIYVTQSFSSLRVLLHFSYLLLTSVFMAAFLK